MKVLQLMESVYHVRLIGKFLGFLAKLCLGFEILLEVIFTGFAVEVEQVVELLNIELVVAPSLA